MTDGGVMDLPTDGTHHFTTESERAVARVLDEAHGTTRRERQHIEIVALAFVGDVARARALRAAHLAEFPDDVLIVHLFDLVEARPRPPP